MLYLHVSFYMYRGSIPARAKKSLAEIRTAELNRRLINRGFDSAVITLSTKRCPHSKRCCDGVLIPYQNINQK